MIKHHFFHQLLAYFFWLQVINKLEMFKLIYEHSSLLNFNEKVLRLFQDHLLYTIHYESSI